MLLKFGEQVSQPVSQILAKNKNDYSSYYSLVSRNAPKLAKKTVVQWWFLSLQKWFFSPKSNNSVWSEAWIQILSLHLTPCQPDILDGFMECREHSTDWLTASCICSFDTLSCLCFSVNGLANEPLHPKSSLLCFQGERITARPFFTLTHGGTQTLKHWQVTCFTEWKKATFNYGWEEGKWIRRR